MARGEVRYRLVADASGVKKGVDEAKTALSSLPASMQNALRAGSSMVDNFAHNATSKLGAAGQALAALGPAGLAAGAAISVVGGAFAAATNQAIVFADRIDNLSQRTGFSTKALQQLDFAARVTNTGLEQVTSGAARMQAELANAPGKFEKLGLSMAELRRLAPEQQLYAVAKAISAIPDQAAKMGAVRDMFGRSGDALLPMISNLEELRAEADRTGYALDGKLLAGAARADDGLDRLSANFDALTRRMGAFLAEAFNVAGAVDNLNVAFGAINATMATPGSRTTSQNARLAGYHAANIMFSLPGQAAGQNTWGKRGPDTGFGATDMVRNPADWAAAMGSLADMEAALKGRTIADKAVEDSAKKLAAEQKATAERLRRWSVAWTLADRVNQSLRLPVLGGLIGSDSLADRVNALLKAPTDAPAVWGGRLGGGSMADRVNAKMGGAFGPSGWESFMSSAPQVLLSALQGGGNVGGALGGALGGAITTKLGETLGKKLGGALGGALGSAVPIVGSLLGAGLGKLVGGLFGDGGKAKREQEKQESLKNALPQLQQLQGQVDALKLQAATDAAKGLGDMFGYLGSQAEVSAERWARMAVIGNGALADLRAQGLSTLAALDLMGPTLDKIGAAAEKTGQAVGGRLGELLGLRNWTQANQEMAAFADGLNSVFEGAVAGGNLTPERFSALMGELNATFTDMTASGASTEQFLMLMAPSLYAAEQAAAQLGIQLDANTLKWIEQAKEAGYFDNLESPMDKVVTALQNMTLLLDAMAKYWGATLPAEVQKYVDSIKKIPPVPGAPSSPGGGPAEPGVPYKPEADLASGGYVPATRGGRIVRLAEGGEGEYVIPESRVGSAPDLAAVVRELASRPIVVEIDGREIAYVTAEQMERGTDGGRRVQRAVREARS